MSRLWRIVQPLLVVVLVAVAWLGGKRWSWVAVGALVVVVVLDWTLRAVARRTSMRASSAEPRR